MLCLISVKENLVMFLDPLEEDEKLEFKIYENIIIFSHIKLN
jgi:hypothetical protein